MAAEVEAQGKRSIYKAADLLDPHKSKA
jgi:hypothetical protein